MANDSSGGRQLWTARNSNCERRRIGELVANLQQSLLTALVIVKNNPRFVASRQGIDRYVFNFTLRDSPTDTINASCWGSEEFIRAVSDCFGIGDVVEVLNSEIRQMSLNNDSGQYKPKASSPFSLTLNESGSSVRLCPTSRPDLEALINIPVNPSCCITPLAEIQNTDQFNGQHVGIPREVVSYKSGQQLLKCDVTVFDQTLNSFVIQLWDVDWIQYARSWTPRDCVIMVQDVRLAYNDFRKVMVATSDGRTVFTVNPETREALMLYTFSQSVATPGDDMETCVELETIKDIFTVERIKESLLLLKDNHFVRGIIYASLTFLDLDGSSAVTSMTCYTCKRRLDSATNSCSNLECPAEANPEMPVEQFDIPVWLSDQTGTLTRIRLKANVAESLLGCTIQDFHKLSPVDKTLLKWQFLMERVKCYFQAVTQASYQRPHIQLLSVAKADVLEVCSKTTTS